MNHAYLHYYKTEIANQLSYFPAFLTHAINSSLIFYCLRSLKIDLQSKNALQQIAASLSNLAEKINQIGIEEDVA